MLSLATSSQRHNFWLVNIISDVEMIKIYISGRGGGGSAMVKNGIGAELVLMSVQVWI